MMFANVSCSQCGGDFGPGEHGFSHCKNHKAIKAQAVGDTFTVEYAKKALATAAELQRLRAALSEIQELFEGDEDIRNDGGPNTAMRVMQIIRGEP